MHIKIARHCESQKTNTQPTEKSPPGRYNGRMATTRLDIHHYPDASAAHSACCTAARDYGRAKTLAESETCAGEVTERPLGGK